MSIAIRNGGGVRLARDLWTVLEAAGQPWVAACWDSLETAMAGESPSISIPTLNARILHVQLRDASIGKDSATLCAIGEGQARVQEGIKRLMGIGYGGYVSVSASTEAALSAAMAKLKQWTQPPAPSKPPRPAKSPAATGAAKPAAAPAKAATPTAATA